MLFDFFKTILQSLLLAARVPIIIPLKFICQSVILMLLLSFLIARKDPRYNAIARHSTLSLKYKFREAEEAREGLIRDKRHGKGRLGLRSLTKPTKGGTSNPDLSKTRAIAKRRYSMKKNKKNKDKHSKSSSHLMQLSQLEHELEVCQKDPYLDSDLCITITIV